MKKIKLLSLAIVGILTIGLVGCGSGTKDDKTIKIGVSAVPHKAIVEQVKSDLEAEGYTLEIQEFSDYVTPNTALQDGDLDANFFQHIAYLNKTNSSKGYDLTYTAEIHIEPMGVYSKTIKNTDDIKDGATIAIPNDPSNEARALRLLAKAGLITINDSEIATPKDIIENKKNLKFTELEAAQLPRILEEMDLAVINGNYALQANLDLNKDAIIVEDKNEESIKDMRNILAVKKGTEDSAKIKALTKSLTSEKVRTYIEETYKGTVIPVF